MNITCRHFYSGDDYLIFWGGWVIEEKKKPDSNFKGKKSLEENTSFKHLSYCIMLEIQCCMLGKKKDYETLLCKAKRDYPCLLVTFKILHGVAPSYLKDLVSVLPVSRYQLRRNNNGILLERPRLRTKKTLGDRALSMAAPFLWNSLPLPIRQETSIDSFKRSVKTYLFKKAFS